MGKGWFSRKTLGLIIITLIFSAAVLSAAVMYRQQTESDVENGGSLPDGIPRLVWNSENYEESMTALESYFYELQPKVAIKNAPDFKWEDICPDHFWVKSFTVTSYSNTSYKVYNFSYINGAKNSKKMAAAIDKEAQEIIDTVRSASQVDKWKEVLGVHDELIKRTTFIRNDDNSGNTRNLYGALVEHKAVCQGYSYAFSYILKKMGFDSKEIFSEEHMWNRIDSLSSTERYIDVTWDDHDTVDSRGESYVHHDFFCLTKFEMEQFEEHTPEGNRSDPDLSDAQSGDNYYTHMGYYIKSGDEIGFHACALEQFRSGRNLLEFRFESIEDYLNAENQIKTVLPTLGYSDKYYTYKRDELMTFSVGLYPADEAQ